ncbi:Protein YdcF [Colletotrichum chlorophyti]|uniref:Protein YdcF n=1 Tax=Colletotrichum chlorophyti TaxID=708187 RepID=A0A1Q8RS25_9PEZI|nr:Protein YdcF [Colletotrichum chlorophyti]
MAHIADAVNALSSFLAHEQIDSVEGLNSFFQSLPRKHDAEVQGFQPTDAIVFCASSVLSLADRVFSALNKDNAGPSGQQLITEGRNTVVVLCGGIGHSTPFLYEAVAKHPHYKAVGDEIQGKPESRVLELIAQRWFGIQVSEAGSEEAVIRPGDKNRLLVVAEDRSTNCGANASESKRVLEACGVCSPRSIVVVQDPTMAKRTVATFEKTYAGTINGMPQIVSWPTFTPRVRARLPSENEADGDFLAQVGFVDGEARGGHVDGLWSMQRFVDLLMGEIPRLRDDANGYGPNGKGFLSHVDIPSTIEEAWKHIDSMLGSNGRAR